MLRTVLILTALAALSSSDALAADAPAVPELGVQLTACPTGPVPEQRAASFTGSMPAVDGSSVLAMRFALEQRRGSDWKPLASPAFARWERSAPGAAGFVYDKRVERLAAGASYRVTVSFRWTAADGTVVRRATRRSGACRQPAPALSPAS